eukprot:XP_025011102.1 spidroin-2-like [Gallus gallus]
MGLGLGGGLGLSRGGLRGCVGRGRGGGAAGHGQLPGLGARLGGLRLGSGGQGAGSRGRQRDAHVFARYSPNLGGGTRSGEGGGEEGPAGGGGCPGGRRGGEREEGKGRGGGTGDQESGPGGCARRFPPPPARCPRRCEVGEAPRGPSSALPPPQRPGTAAGRRPARCSRPAGRPGCLWPGALLPFRRRQRSVPQNGGCSKRREMSHPHEGQPSEPGRGSGAAAAPGTAAAAAAATGGPEGRSRSAGPGRGLPAASDTCAQPRAGSAAAAPSQPRPALVWASAGPLRTEARPGHLRPAARSGDAGLGRAASELGLAWKEAGEGCLCGKRQKSVNKAVPCPDTIVLQEPRAEDRVPTVAETDLRSCAEGEGKGAGEEVTPGRSRLRQSVKGAPRWAALSGAARSSWRWEAWAGGGPGGNCLGLENRAS